MAMTAIFGRNKRCFFQERMAPMSKALAPSKKSVVTARDSKGRKFMAIVEEAYNGKALSPEEAQLVNEAPGLADLVDGFIEQHRYIKNSSKEKARRWKEATKNAYGMMGMAAAYDQFCKEQAVKGKDGHWTILMLKDLSHAKIAEAIKRAGSGYWAWSDELDEKVPTNDRDPNRDGSYAIGVRSVIEADEENANKSANQLAKEGHKGMTLMERLMLELIHFLATGEHLDIKNVTLCSGSRHANGHVPHVRFGAGFGRVHVSRYPPGRCRDFLRSRSAVSLPTEPSGAQV